VIGAACSLLFDEECILHQTNELYRLLVLDPPQTPPYAT
jgi:hypothetical protein